MESGLGLILGDYSQDTRSHRKEGKSRIWSMTSTEKALFCPQNKAPRVWEGSVTGASGQASQPHHLCPSHSRIEWVWLHWSEYLLAQDEFYRWFQKMVVALEPPVELQLGLKEKQWQLSHAQVLLHNVDNQAVLLDRLLEEAGSLFSRIGDPSVDEDAQKRMKAEYDAVKARAQVSGGWLHHPNTYPPHLPLQSSAACSWSAHSPLTFHSTSWPDCSFPGGISEPPSSHPSPQSTHYLSSPPAHSFISLALPR